MSTGESKLPPEELTREGPRHGREALLMRLYSTNGLYAQAATEGRGEDADVEFEGPARQADVPSLVSKARY